MRIIKFHSEAISSFKFMSAGQGQGLFYEAELPIHHAHVDRLPSGISALVVTADLQGRQLFQDAADGPPRLLGEVVPQRLVDQVLPEFRLKSQSSVAALLAGDFYTLPALDKRGGTGDVTNVWQAFADCFTWVAGVPGNHDLFGGGHSTRPRFSDPMHFLDGDIVEIGGFRIGGIGGIIGKPTRPQRRTEEEYFQTLDDVLSQGVDVMVMHEGPDGVSSSQRGMPQIREILKNHKTCLTIRGNAHWDEPFAEFSTGHQVLNVDARVVILTD